MCEYIYLVQEREFIKTNEEIYKIGKSKQENLKRFNSYPKGSELLFQCVCNDCSKIENILIKLFKEKYELQKNIGNEYFKGYYIDMIKDIYDTIMVYYKDARCVIEDNIIMPIEENLEIVKDKKYKCDKCDKKYNTLEYYKNHIKDCNISYKIDNLTCPTCMKSFYNKDSKNRHIRNGKCKPKSIAFANYNFTNNFENERLDYITKEVIYEKCFNDDYPIFRLIELIHFNKDYPENQNIRYDIKNKLTKIKKDNIWTTIDIDNLINKLFINNSRLLTNYYNDYKDYFDNLINNINHIEEINTYINHNILEELQPKNFNLMTKETKNTIKTF